MVIDCTNIPKRLAKVKQVKKKNQSSLLETSIVGALGCRVRLGLSCRELLGAKVGNENGHATKLFLNSLTFCPLFIKLRLHPIDVLKNT